MICHLSPARATHLRIAAGVDMSIRQGSQSEYPHLAQVGEALHVTGYQIFEIAASGAISYHTQPSKYDTIKAILADLVTTHRCTTLADVGCNNGLVSFLANREGFTWVHSLDHDAPAVRVIDTIAKIRGLPMNASTFSFGSEPLPQVDVVFLGALIHWVFCLTADFGGSFERIFSYLTASARKFLVIEWVAPQDGAIKSFHHISKCAAKPKDPYTTYAFERALRLIGNVSRKIPLVEPNQRRTLYVVKLKGGQKTRPHF